jgi:hypothetical protein
MRSMLDTVQSVPHKHIKQPFQFNQANILVATIPAKDANIYVPDNHDNLQKRRQQRHERVQDQTHNVPCDWFGPHTHFSIADLHVQNSGPRKAAMPQEVI